MQAHGSDVGTNEEGLVNDISEASGDLGSFLAELKAKYGLLGGLNSASILDAKLAGSGGSPGGSIKALHLQSPGLLHSAPAAAAAAFPTDQQAGASLAQPLPGSPQAAHASFSSSPAVPPLLGEGVLGEDDEESYRQLLQLEALEEQLVRQQLLGSPRSGDGGALDAAGVGGDQASPPDLSFTAATADLETPASEAAGRGGSPSSGLGHGLSGPAPWIMLNQSLMQLGFPPVPGAGALGGHPDSAAVYSVLSSVLSECDRYRRHSQQLGEAAQNAARREEALLRSFEAAVKEKEGEAHKWKRLALESQKGLREAQQLERQSQRAAQKAAADCRILEGCLAQLQHELRSKEAEADRLQQRLKAALEKEERKAQADKRAHEALKRAFAASKAASTPKERAAFVASAAREMRPIDIVRVYEEEKADLQEEVAIVKAENRVLEGQLQRAKDSLHRNDTATGSSSGGADEGQARAMARQSAAAEERAARLAEEVATLQQELALRPTSKQYESLQRQLDIMVRQLSAQEAEKAAAKAKDGSAKPKLKQLTTREAIQRDKDIARLGLSTVAEFPKPVMLEILQDACITLECSDALKLCEAIKPVQETAGMVPCLQRFVDEICWVVHKKGLAHVPDKWRQDSPCDVPAILGQWVTELGELMELRGMLRALLRLLGGRAGLKPSERQPSSKDVVPLVGQLVELERAALHSREVIQAAEAVLVAQPELLINRIVRQIQELFGCKGLEGVLPCMNKLYLSHTEAQIFLGSLRNVLGVDAGASLEAIAIRVSQLLDHQTELLGTTLPNAQWRPPRGSAGGTEGWADGGVEIVERPRRADLQRAAEVAVDRMAARRNFPKVEIYVPAPQQQRQPLAEQAANQCGGSPVRGAAAVQSRAGS